MKPYSTGWPHMPQYRWNTDHNAWSKQCSCCEVLTIGTANEAESVDIFLKTFSPSRGCEAADEMQSRCWVCNSGKRRSLGITLEWLRDMHERQEGCCGICSIPISLDRNAPNPGHVDHDHTNGNPRQLLCGNCNRGLGLFFDNPEFLREAADYIEFHRSNDA